MLDKQLANDIIHEALSLGADFCDIFIERTANETVTFSSSEVKNIQSGIDFGIGIRLIYKTQSLYGYTNSHQKEDLIVLTRKLGSFYQNAKQGQTFEALDFTKPLNYPQIKAYLGDNFSLDHKISKLKNLDQLTRAQSEFVSQVNLTLLQKNTQVEIFNSEGLWASEERPYIRLGATATTKDGELQADGGQRPGARGDYNYIESLDINELSEEIVRQSLTSLRAKPSPAGKMPVIIDNAFGGVIFHEACGHLLETTSVEKKASVLWDKKGELIAHEDLCAVDDGTMENEWGSLSIDDEGMPTQKTQLIKNGVLTNFLSDRLGSLKTGHPRTGSGRKQNYRYAPASRMRNTFIEVGKYSFDDLLSSMEDGIYAKSMGGGSVNPGTGEFNFSVQEGYLVKNGKIKEAIKGATLIGKGEDVLKKISMSANNFALATGMCGSVSGSVPTTVGQPAVKVDDILVGGIA